MNMTSACEVCICSQVYYASANVKQVDVPSFSGSFGILPNHVPSLAVLKPGVVTVFEQDGSNKKFFGMYHYHQINLCMQKRSQEFKCLLRNSMFH